MKSYDFDAVAYDGEIYCIACLPEGVNSDHPEVSPIFADSEWDHYPVCGHCHGVHDYVSLTEDGRIYDLERQISEAFEGEFMTPELVLPTRVGMVRRPDSFDALPPMRSGVVVG